MVTPLTEEATLECLCQEQVAAMCWFMRNTAVLCKDFAGGSGKGVHFGGAFEGRLGGDKPPNIPTLG